MSGIEEAAMKVYDHDEEAYVFIIHTKVVFADKDWVRFEGSQERLYIPDHTFKVGNPVNIRIAHE